MKYIFIITVLSVCIAFTACKHDTSPMPVVSAPPTPVPFVEYRDSFSGTYRGTVLKIRHREIYASGSPGVFPPDDTLDYRVSILNTITKSATNDSMLLTTDPSRVFNIKGTGKCYYQSRQCAGCQDSTYHIVFRNDSVYMEMYFNMGTDPLVTWYQTTFIGKKQ